MAALYGGIEAGGTKFVCALGTGPEELVAETTFPTTTPDETLERAVHFFREQAHGKKLLSIGVGSFGPVDPNPRSATYGYITTTPKPGWANFNIVGELKSALDVPVAFDTDVNAAALGEGLWGAGRSRDPLVYITIGTGIGGGLLCGGVPVHGLLHPEFGHMYLPHDFSADPFPGACPYHGDCLEGLAAGPALAKRWGQRGETLPADHVAWKLEAHYLGLAISNLIFTVAPQAIILGGGVLDQPGLLDMIRQETERLLKGYIRSPWLKSGLRDFILRPGLGRRAGVLGSIALALREDWR
jgi:fructokinase